MAGCCTLVVSGLMFGGGQRVVMDLAKEGATVGGRPEIVLLGCGTEYFNEFDPRVVSYDGRYNRSWTLLKTAWRLGEVLRGSDCVLLHTHGWDADIITWLARLMLDTQQLIHLHVTPEWFDGKGPRKRFRRWLTRRTLLSRNTHVVAVSDAVKKHWSEALQLPSDSIGVVRNGIDIQRYQPSGRESVGDVPVIGVAARLAPMKGIEYLVDALGCLAAEGMEFRLRIAGTGRLREALEGRCRQAGISGWTEFLGHVDDMPAFYRTLDLYALPSVSTEGLPLGVLEAMACGLPVVATTVAGTPEAVRDGIEGLLVPPRDSTALAGALRRLLADPQVREAMGCAGRVRAVESFSLERFSSEIFALYREILGESPE